MADLVGQQLGNYRLVRLLGRGGLADIYLGEHVRLNTLVAVRALSPQPPNENLDKFRNEVLNIARLTHPNILRILDFGQEGNIPFIVEDYAPNGSLRQRHPKGTKVALTTIIPYVRQVANALDYVHAQKIIHRDVKPENMLVGRNNEILLSDFGISVVADISSQSMQDVAGTVIYMAPEQIQGMARPASDLYSLGIIVYEWLSGNPPFQGQITEIMAKHLSVQPPSLHEKVPTIPPDVEWVIMIALSKDPVQRFQSVQAFSNALEQASHIITKAPSASKSPLPAITPAGSPGESGASHSDETISASTAAPIAQATPDKIENPAHLALLADNGEVLQDFVLEKLETSIGRAPTSDILLSKDKHTSRRHATIRYENGTYALYDERSANGTFVNGEQLTRGTPYLLKNGDTVRMGSTQLVYEGSSANEFNASIPAIPPLSAPVGMSPSPSTYKPEEESENWSTGYADLSMPASILASDITGATRRPTEETELSLFAITYTALEDGDIAFVGRTYVVQAGISQNKPDKFFAEPFNVIVENIAEPITFDILLHESENIELTTTWHKRLLYKPDNLEPQLVDFTFRVMASGKSSLIIDFYHERRWLRTFRLEFDAIEKSQLIPVSAEV